MGVHFRPGATHWVPRCPDRSVFTIERLRLSHIISPAHKDLCNIGILHRDISAGNVLLTMPQNGPLRGFITDLEFARIDSPTLLKPESTVTSMVAPQIINNDSGRIISLTPETSRTHIRFESSVVVKRGAGMTVSY